MIWISIYVDWKYLNERGVVILNPDDLPTQYDRIAIASASSSHEVPETYAFLDGDELVGRLQPVVKDGRYIGHKYYSRKQIERREHWQDR